MRKMTSTSSTVHIINNNNHQSAHLFTESKPCEDRGEFVLTLSWSSLERSAASFSRIISFSWLTSCSVWVSRSAISSTATSPPAAAPWGEPGPWKNGGIVSKRKHCIWFWMLHPMHSEYTGICLLTHFRDPSENVSNVISQYCQCVYLSVCVI